MFKRLFLLCTFLTLGINTNANALNSSKVNTLREKLLKNYRSDTIPNNGEPLNLSMGLAMRAFNNINQIDGTVELNVWLRYWWNDYNLVWDTNKWNISSLTFRTEPGLDGSVWIPDIYLYNTAENPLENLKYSNLEVDNNGNIIWSRPGIIKATCAFDLTNFPYDRQLCKIKLGSWTYNGYQLVLQEGFPPIDTENYQPNEEWNLETINHTINAIKYACCPYEYYDITFDINIKRFAGYYETNIIIPTFATASLILITLLIPWESGERISFAVTVMLSIIVFLLLLSDTLPKSNQRPLLSRMITGLTFFSLCGVLFTVLISALNDYKDKLDDSDDEIDNKVIRCLFNLCNKITGNKYGSCYSTGDGDNTYVRDGASEANTSPIDIMSSNTKIDSQEANLEFNIVQECLTNETTFNDKLRTISYSHAMEEEAIVPVRKRVMNTMNTMNTMNNPSPNMTIYSKRKYDNKYNTKFENDDNKLNNKEYDNTPKNNAQNNSKKIKRTKLQKQCDNMIRTVEYIYSIGFFIVFISLCIIIAVARVVYA
jgi:nicotinic acetylcholine receptor, invertebrate